MFCSLLFLPGQSPDLLSALSHGTTPSNLYHSHYHILSTGIALPIHMKSTSHWPFFDHATPLIHTYWHLSFISFTSPWHGRDGFGFSLVPSWFIYFTCSKASIYGCSTSVNIHSSLLSEAFAYLGYLTLFVYTTMNSNTTQISNGV